MIKNDAEKKIDELFDELVPASGKADTVAGEIIRAVCRIGYRYSNDGDQIGYAYGNETCNAPARFLMKTCGGAIEQTVGKMFWVVNDDEYLKLLQQLEHQVLKYIRDFPDLKDTTNSVDMWDFKRPEDNKW